jgi:hypothetical protein
MKIINKILGGIAMSDFWEKEELIGKIEKNGKEEIHVKKVEKNSRQFIDIRMFWLEKESNEFKPSSKGIAIPVEVFEEFKEVIMKA